MLNPNKPSGLISNTRSVVFITAKITYMHMMHMISIYLQSLETKVLQQPYREFLSFFLLSWCGQLKWRNEIKAFFLIWLKKKDKVTPDFLNPRR